MIAKFSSDAQTGTGQVRVNVMETDLGEHRYQHTGRKQISSYKSNNQNLKDL